MKKPLLSFRNYLQLAAIIFAGVCVWMILSASIAQPSVPSTPVSDYNADVATAWFEMQLQLVRDTPGFTPPVASRAFGYTGVALYEAIVAGMPDYQSLVGQLNALEKLPQPLPGLEYHWPTVANSALATITRLLFANTAPENKMAIENLYDETADMFKGKLDADVLNRSAVYGADVARAVWAWSLTDGGHQGYMTNFPAEFMLVTGTGMWVPTPRFDGDPQPALQPYWGNNRPFVLESGAECMASAPPAYSEVSDSAFYAEVAEVYETSQHLTQDQMDIAIFWADDPGQTSTPPGHSISILTQILKQENARLDFAAAAYARMGIAVADAFIGCWYAKYEYNLIRPVTVIQTLIDESWMPIVNTPPFPEYPSGHSVQSGAAAAVLADLFGDSYHFTDMTHEDLGLPSRTFDSFSQFAAEAAISRLYGGIHYRAAIEIGLEQGRCIGEQVNALHFQTG